MVLGWWEHFKLFNFHIYIPFTKTLKMPEGGVRGRGHVIHSFIFHTDFPHSSSHISRCSKYLHSEVQHGGRTKHLQRPYTYSGLGLVTGCRNAYDGCVCMCAFWQQGWCLGRHVRGGRLLFRHLHCHLVSGQDVLEKKTRGKRVTYIFSVINNHVWFFFFC